MPIISSLGVMCCVFSPFHAFVHTVPSTGQHQPVVTLYSAKPSPPPPTKAHPNVASSMKLFQIPLSGVNLCLPPWISITLCLFLSSSTQHSWHCIIIICVSVLSPLLNCKLHQSRKPLLNHVCTPHSALSKAGVQFMMKEDYVYEITGKWEEVTNSSARISGQVLLWAGLTF